MSMRWTAEDLLEFEKRTEKLKKPVTVRTHLINGKQDGPKRHSKYGNRQTFVDGLRFDSAKEASRWQELKLLEKAGEIVELERQVRFELRVNRQEVCAYVADFTYRPNIGRSLIVEDVKGHKTREYVIKKKLMKAIHGIEIKET